MKNHIYLSFILLIFLFSCESNPNAHFSTDTTIPEVGQKVYFLNSSHNAKRFKWDFGDGFTSTEENPVHVFNATGPVDVVLTAVSRSGLEDKTVLSLNVMIPTLLEVEVVEYYDKYIVPNADVYLYSSISDWDTHNDNYESVGLTDKNGIVVFSQLGPYVYYIDTWEKNHDNYTLRTEDINWVRTQEIIPHQINRFTAWVDYYTDSKGTERERRYAVIKKIERKADERKQTSAFSSTENWKELFEKSVKLR
jgi:hypothetical protein